MALCHPPPQEVLLLVSFGSRPGACWRGGHLREAPGVSRGRGHDSTFERVNLLLGITRSSEREGPRSGANWQRRSPPTLRTCRLLSMSSALDLPPAHYRSNVSS